MNCKHFYVLTPWIGDRMDPEFTEDSCTKNKNESLPTSPIIDANTAPSVMQNNFTSKSIEENKNVLDRLTITKTTEQTTRETRDSTLANSCETSSVCNADEVISPSIIENEKYFYSGQYKCVESTKLSESSDAGTSVSFKLPELDLSPISHNSTKFKKNINIAKSEIRTDSNNRFRSLSHENRTVSSADYFNTRRGCSVSPPARNKNKRSTKQMQSKIPTLSPLAHRVMQHNRETDGSVTETANQIRSVLLKKLKEVWEQHPRETTARSPNYSRDSSFETSVYSMPEGVSRIPLPRRSPRQSNARNHLTPWTRLIDQIDRATDQSGQSSGHSETTNKDIPEDVTVPSHSTPKSSPLSRGNYRHGQ